MRIKVLMGIILAVALSGCSLLKKAPAPIVAVVTAAQGTICPLAQEYADELGSKLASMTGASNPLACGSELYQPLINAQICNQPIPAAPAGSAFAVMASQHPEWKTIGDITKDDLDKLKGMAKPETHNLAHPNGIISALACPLGIGTIMGVASAKIPNSCQGPNSLASSDLDKAAVTICQTLTVSLP